MHQNQEGLATKVTQFVRFLPLRTGTSGAWQAKSPDLLDLISKWKQIKAFSRHFGEFRANIWPIPSKTPSNRTF